MQRVNHDATPKNARENPSFNLLASRVRLKFTINGVWVLHLSTGVLETTLTVGGPMTNYGAD